MTGFLNDPILSYTVYYFCKEQYIRVANTLVVEDSFDTVVRYTQLRAVFQHNKYHCVTEKKYWKYTIDEYDHFLCLFGR